MSVASARVPATLASGRICLLLGLAGGVVIASFTEVNLNKQAAANPNDGADVKDPAAGSKAGPPGMPGAGGGGKGGGGKGGFAPNPKRQLTDLVGRIDTLTKKPLAVTLSPEQKQKTKDILAGLDAKEELTDDEAKGRLEALLKVVEGDRTTLEAAGYRWPGSPPPGGGGGGGMTAPPPNPFKEGEAANRLKSLQETIAK